MQIYNTWEELQTIMDWDVTSMELKGTYWQVHITKDNVAKVVLVREATLPVN